MRMIQTLHVCVRLIITAIISISTVLADY